MVFKVYDKNSQNDGIEVVQTTNLSGCELISVSCSNIYLANLEIANLVIVLFLGTQQPEILQLKACQMTPFFRESI